MGGPSMKNDELQQLVKILNPDKIEGKLVLITRYGAGKIESMLPGHIEAVKAAGVPVVWQCDGVHGNTVTAKCAGNLKTRALNDVLSECTQAVRLGARGGAPRDVGAGDDHRVHRRRHDGGHAAQQLRDLLRPSPQLRASHRGGLQDQLRRTGQPTGQARARSIGDGPRRAVSRRARALMTFKVPSVWSLRGGSEQQQA